jgi:predicted TIM-barrel fold metal-dependent hydrolase
VSDAHIQTISWHHGQRGRVAYQGYLADGAALTLHCGVDGWRHPIRDIPMDYVVKGVAVADVPDVDGHLALDCSVTDGDRWDNNYDANYRLWVGDPPIDSHVHAANDGYGRLGFGSLRAALRSAGIDTAVVSTMDNCMDDRMVVSVPRLYRLAWVSPGQPSVDELRHLLNHGYVGIKLHPSYNRYQADDHRLDPYVQVVQDEGGVVAVHSGPAESDPDLIRRLAERFPAVAFVLYHTYLGPGDGRQRAVRHTHELPNLYLETSWCGFDDVRWLIDQVGPERVVFGSDAAVDGPVHYTQSPANLAGNHNYNEYLILLAGNLEEHAARLVLRENTMQLFGMNYH